MERRRPRTDAESQEAAFAPPTIRSIADTGLPLSYLVDMVLKLLYYRESGITGLEISDAIRLPFVGVLDQVMDFLRQEHFCEVKGSGGLGQSSYQYSLAERGMGRAREILEQDMYVGPAPVTLDQYTAVMKRQSLRKVIVHRRHMLQALGHLVLNDRTIDQVGPAVNSGRSIFLFGPPGNGKTEICEAIGRIVAEEVLYIPYAIVVERQLIRVFDPVSHKPADTEDKPAPPALDRRWIQIQRPLVSVGGELTLTTLDLVFDPISKTYEAPFQMKANGGMFHIDDFGRQLIRPADLLNRWIVPLEKKKGSTAKVAILLSPDQRVAYPGCSLAIEAHRQVCYACVCDQIADCGPRR
ncbi:MAG: hypothetical protein ISS56_14365, partial [Anaerolineae bacterium]|nr:hypothetical protein [Anaerolineae bacterium]